MLRHRQGRPHLIVRTSSHQILALKLLARRKNITLSEYVREALNGHLRDLYYTRTSPVIHLKELSRLTKEFIVTYRSTVRIASKLPAAEKRDDLEKICWQAVQQAVKYSASESTAAKAEARVSALQVLSMLMRTHLAIVNSQDEAYVDKLIEELEENRTALEEEAEKAHIEEK